MALKRWRWPKLLRQTGTTDPGNAYSFQKHSYVARGRYLNQLDRYEALFPSDSCWC